MAKKKTLSEKIQKKLDKLEVLHNKEELVIEEIKDLISDDEDEE